MANDVEDWTGQQLVQLVSQDGTAMGDASGAVLAPDLLVETLLASVAARPGTTAQGASFKAAAGQVIAPHGVRGAFAIGSDTAVNPAWDAATSAGDFGLAYVICSGQGIATGAAGWVEVGPISSDGQTSLWYKPALGAAEAAPTFTSTFPVAGEPMMAQLLRFTGVDAAAPLDRTADAPFGRPVQTLNFSVKDVDFGDLVAGCFNWPMSSSVVAGFSDSLNNGAVAVDAASSGGAARTRHASFVYGLTVAPPAAVPVGVAAWPYDSAATHAPAAGSVATVTLAAVPGKAYTVAMLDCSLGQTGATATTIGMVVEDEAAVIFNRPLAVTAAVGPGGVLSHDQMGLRGTPGNVLTVRFLAAVAGVLERVNVGAYLR